MGDVLRDRCKVPPALWRAMERAGFPPEALLRQARLPATLHLNADALVTTTQFFSLWKAIEQLIPEPGLGLRLVEAMDTAAFPPSTLSAFYARDYRDGLLRLARFKRLCTPEQLHWHEEKGTCALSVEWLSATEPTPAIATDVAFSTLIELGRRGTGQRIIPSRVELVRPAPQNEVYQDYFECPIHYGAEADVLVLKAADLERPFSGSNPELLQILTPALTCVLEELQAHSSIGVQIKIVLKRSLASGRPELSQVARDLGMSERTLQRRITEEGTTFRALLMEARHELARQLLSAPETSIDEVAYLLGYQDANAFYRAFREWEGVTPARWRDGRANVQLDADS